MVEHTLRLTRAQVWRWAKAHHERTGRWPGRDSGPIVGGPDVSWSTIDRCLRRGGHGLSGGSSLSRFLRESGGLQNLRRAEPGLTRKQILEWADLHYERTGQWPDRDSGPVIGAPHIAWGTIEKRLRRGGLNLPGGMTLTRLLREARGVWDRRGKPRLTEKRILKWADAHFNRTGRWPVTLSGSLHDAANEDWAAIDMALRDGRRGLAGGSSLARLLAEHRGKPYRRHAQRLTVKQVVQWAREHHDRTGKWPTRLTGVVRGADGETWGEIDTVLRVGGRGLHGGTSLSRLLEKYGCAVTVRR